MASILDCVQKKVSISMELETMIYVVLRIAFQVFPGFIFKKDNEIWINE